MRYISHELRTPLNIAFLGLKILNEDLSKLGLSDGILETLKDTKESCLAALDILNDLLLYDCISSGIMTMQKSILDPVALISNALRPFRTQAMSNRHLIRKHVFVSCVFIHFRREMLALSCDCN